MILPNWNVIARSEFTPSIVRAGIAFEPNANDIQAAIIHHSFMHMLPDHINCYLPQDLT